MDDIDFANETMEQVQADALNAWRRKQVSGPGSSVCIDCEEDIPEARRKAQPSCVRCIDCQDEFEKQR